MGTSSKTCWAASMLFLGPESNYLSDLDEKVEPMNRHYFVSHLFIWLFGAGKTDSGSYLCWNDPDSARFLKSFRWFPQCLFRWPPSHRYFGRCAQGAQALHARLAPLVWLLARICEKRKRKRNPIKLSDMSVIFWNPVFRATSKFIEMIRKMIVSNSQK